MTDEQWAINEPIVSDAQREQRRGCDRTVSLREVVNTILCTDRTGCHRIAIPNPTSSTPECPSDYVPAAKVTRAHERTPILREMWSERLGIRGGGNAQQLALRGKVS